MDVVAASGDSEVVTSGHKRRVLPLVVCGVGGGALSGIPTFQRVVASPPNLPIAGGSEKTQKIT
jgi:hypothetical protein